MLTIEKQNIPPLLVEYKAKPNAIYDGPDFTPVKQAIRLQLVQEQKGLCAYCMRRISASATGMKVEHWKSQKVHLTLQLDYQNLLGVCLGHEGQSPKSQTCDTRKGDLELKFNPSLRAHAIFSKVYYESADGSIRSADSEFDHEIGAETGSVLNLNHQLLKLNRKAVLSALQDSLNIKSGNRSKAEIQRKIDDILQKSTFQEYAGVLLYFLRKYLQRVN